MKKPILITTALLGLLGIAGMARSFHWAGQHPVVLVHSATESIGSTTGDANTEVDDEHIPAALKQVGESAEQIYDLAKGANWSQMPAVLTTLSQSLYQLEGDRPHIGQLSRITEQLRSAVAAKNQLATQDLANQVTFLAAQMSQEYPTRVPVQVTLLDYYGRQLEIEAARQNLTQLQATAKHINQTWQALRPEILARGGTTEAQKFDSLVRQQPHTTSDYSHLATEVLSQVDQLETVFK